MHSARSTRQRGQGVSVPRGEPRATGTRDRVRTQSLKEAILLALDLVDLAEGRGVGGEWPFDGERRQPAPSKDASSIAVSRA